MTGDWSKCCPNGALRPSEWRPPIPAIGTYRRWFVRSRIFASSTSSASRLHETSMRVIYADALVPAGTPGPIIGRLNAETIKVLGRADVKATLVAQGLEVAPGSPEQFAAHIKSEIARFTKI